MLSAYSLMESSYNLKIIVHNHDLTFRHPFYIQNLMDVEKTIMTIFNFDLDI